MDPLLTQCRTLFGRAAPALARDHDGVARALWGAVRTRLAGPDQDILLAVFEHDPDARDDSPRARRRRHEARRLLLGLRPEWLACEIARHECRRSAIALLAELAELDLARATCLWDQGLATGTGAALIEPLLDAPSREVREWAISLLAQCA